MKRALLATLLAAFFAPAVGLAEDKEVLRIGVPRTVLREIPPALVTYAGQAFKDLIKTQSGLNGEVVHEEDTIAIGIKYQISARRTPTA